MSEVKYLTTLVFTPPVVNYDRRPSIYNSRGWPDEPERASRTVVFSDNNVYGAFLYTSKDIILFTLDLSKNSVKFRSELGIRCKENVTSMVFGHKNGINVISAKLPPTCNTDSCNSQEEYVLATGHCNGEIRLWDAATSQLITTLISHNRTVTDLAFSPRTAFNSSCYYSNSYVNNNNYFVQLISASADMTLKVWDFEATGVNMCQTKTHPHPLLCFAWSPGGHMIATGGTGRKVHIYRMSYQIRELVHLLSGHLSSVVAIKFSPDDALIATASMDTRVNLWDSVTGILLRTLCHAYPIPHLLFGTFQVRSMDIDPFLTSIITVADDAKLRVWDPLKSDVEEADPRSICEQLSTSYTANLYPEIVLDLKEEGKLACTFIKDGKWVAVSSMDTRNVVIYEVTQKVPKLAHLCRLAVRKSIAFRPNGVESLCMPRTIKDFLNYHY